MLEQRPGEFICGAYGVVRGRWNMHFIICLKMFGCTCLYCTSVELCDLRASVLLVLNYWQTCSVIKVQRTVETH